MPFIALETLTTGTWMDMMPWIQTILTVWPWILNADGHTDNLDICPHEINRCTIAYTTHCFKLDVLGLVWFAKYTFLASRRLLLKCCFESVDFGSVQLTTHWNNKFRGPVFNHDCSKPLDVDIRVHV